MLFSTLVVETGLKAFAELYNFISCKEQQRAEGERVRNNERENVREREKRVENERIKKLEKRVRNSKGEFLTCSEFALFYTFLPIIQYQNKVLAFFISFIRVLFTVSCY